MTDIYFILLLLGVHTADAWRLCQDPSVLGRTWYKWVFVLYLHNCVFAWYWYDYIFSFCSQARGWLWPACLCWLLIVDNCKIAYIFLIMHLTTYFHKLQPSERLPLTCLHLLTGERRGWSLMPKTRWNSKWRSWKSSKLLPFSLCWSWPSPWQLSYKDYLNNEIICSNSKVLPSM